MRSLIHDYAIVGEALWGRFKGTRAQTEWYYRSILDALSVLEDYPMYQQLKACVEQMFG